MSYYGALCESVRIRQRDEQVIGLLTEPLYPTGQRRTMCNFIQCIYLFKSKKMIHN